MSRLRLSESQFAMFQQPEAASKNGPRAPRQRKPKEQLPENIVEQPILDFLRAKGWTVTRNQVGTYVPLGRIMRFLESGAVSREQIMRNIVRIGEKGMADWRAERPIIPPGERAEDGPWPHEVFFLEVKASGRKPDADQLSWLEARRRTGTMAWWVNEFEDDGFETLDPHISHVFLRWYGAYFGGGR